MAETLDVTSMIPNKFEPKRKNRWVLMIEGIDAYILKTAARPQISTEEVADLLSTRLVTLQARRLSDR